MCAYLVEEHRCAVAEDYVAVIRHGQVGVDELETPEFTPYLGLALDVVFPELGCVTICYQRHGAEVVVLLAGCLAFYAHHLVCVVALDELKRRQNQVHKDDLAQRLSASFEQIRHRGPDSTGQWISEDGRVALGHVRLEINDLTTSGHQPLHSTDNTVHAVVNGEIYDYEELRQEMQEKLQYEFQGTSDSELVLALYKYYGLSFLSQIRGEYSICLLHSTCSNWR